MAEYKSRRDDLLKAISENDKYDKKIIKKALDFATEYQRRAVSPFGRALYRASHQRCNSF